jgi:hypothetical protein
METILGTLLERSRFKKAPTTMYPSSQNDGAVFEELLLTNVFHNKDSVSGATTMARF